MNGKKSAKLRWWELLTIHHLVRVCMHACLRACVCVRERDCYCLLLPGCASSRAALPVPPLGTLAADQAAALPLRVSVSHSLSLRFQPCLTFLPCYPVRGAAGGEGVCVEGDLSVAGRRLIVVELFSHANAAAGETQTQIHTHFTSKPTAAFTLFIFWSELKFTQTQSCSFHWFKIQMM